MAATSVVIVGAGHAGGAAAAALRANGFGGAITLIGEEPHPPYQRPPLSKDYLKGALAVERLYLKPVAYYAERNIGLRMGVRAVAIDRGSRSVALSDGAVLSYDRLILATGSRARRLPADDCEGVFSVRTLADIDRLRSRMTLGRRLAIVGGGYIGLEAAAVARTLGLDVILLEAQSRLLGRVAGLEIADYFEKLHRRNGVDLRLGVQGVGLRDAGGVLCSIEASGQVLNVDTCIVGIGVSPCDELAISAGLACDGGVITDSDARTSDPCIFAIGDCSLRPLRGGSRVGRLESVHNAVEQAKLAAAAICGLQRPAIEVPWFWSDQYDVKLQTAGLFTGHDQTVVRGDPDADRFAVYYLAGSRLIAVDAVNSPPDFLVGRKMIAAGASPDIQQLADTSIGLKTLAGV